MPVVVLATLISVGLAGCAPAVTEPAEETYEPPATAYSYVANAERTAQIKYGFNQLQLGQSRAQVRAILGPPDSAGKTYGPPSIWDSPATGWFYLYRIRSRVGSPNVYDEQVELFFNEQDSLVSAFAENIAGLRGFSRPGS